jgi:drug/metabolite transporter (DMT)-like permease
MSPRTPVKEAGFAPHLALIAVQFMFATWPIVGKVVLQTISSAGLVGLRVLGAAVVFVSLRGKLRQLLRLPRRDLVLLTLCSLLGVVINQLIFVKGLTLTTVINASLIGTTIPVFTLIVSIVLGYDRLSLRRTAGILLAAAGVVYLVDPLRAQFSAQTTTGNLLIITNSFCYGAYIAISKDLFKRYGAFTVISWMFAIGCLVTTPIGAYALSKDPLSTASIWIWVAMIYIILIPTVAAYYLNAWALMRVPPTTVATYIYLQPLIAFGLAPLLLGEKLSPRTLIACILIFAGVGVVVRRARSRAAKDVIEHPDAMAH